MMRERYGMVLCEYLEENDNVTIGQHCSVKNKNQKNALSFLYLFLEIWFINCQSNHPPQLVTLHIEAEKKWPPFPGRHFQVHFLEWKCLNLYWHSLTFILKGQINNIPALIQVMAWHQSGDKPLVVPMIFSLLTHSASMSWPRVASSNCKEFT